MIKKIEANKESFKEVTFNNDFNLVLADRTKTSTSRDSRNGLGKSLLVDIIHFGLGAQPSTKEDLKSDKLKDWSFKFQFDINDHILEIERSVEENRKIFVTDDLDYLAIRPQYDEKDNRYFYSLAEWNTILGKMYLGLPISKNDGLKYTPTFRSLISYFIRRGFTGFTDPFKNKTMQKPWDTQVNNSFLLNLNWEYASQIQLIKDKDQILQNLSKASSMGYLSEFAGTTAELNTEKVRLTDQAEKLEKNLKEFKVHPEYENIQREADALLIEIQSHRNSLVIKEQILNKYKSSVKNETDSLDVAEVKQVYKELGVYFESKLTKRLDEVLQFHNQISANREDYLETEINKLENEIQELKGDITKLESNKSELMRILNSYGALDEHTQMEKRLVAVRQELSNTISRIETLEKIKKGKSEITVERETLVQRAELDLKGRQEFVDAAIKIFNANSEFLYEEPGNLLIEINKFGYQFNIDIKRARSQGVNLMKVFCYDLTVAELRKQFNLPIPPLVHDSTIFSDVDERQVARALELAAQKSKELGFQYICTMNSDNLPINDLSTEFKANLVEGKYLRLTLTDETEDGCLLGMRF